VTYMKPLLKVRTVTLGLSLLPNQPDAWDLELARAAAFVSSARRRLEDAGYEVQTTRISSQSFESWVDVSDATAALEAFRRLDATLLRLGVGLFNAGPATSPEGLALVPQIVALGPRISASGAMPGPLDRAAASRLADAILTISQTTAGGEGNFQFCASFNVPPKTPFFPASYHEGASPSFAIGCETSELLAHAMPRAGGDLPRAKALLVDTFTDQLLPLQAIARQLSQAHGLQYDGIDASVAPMGDASPLTGSFESLGLGSFGQSGTLAAAALVTGALKELPVDTCGYCGLMLPPLEDAGLARGAADGAYRIHDLLAYSAVCGLGLDTVPVPGDVPKAKLAALLLDVAALAFRLNKPLTARLFPVPGKAAGDAVEFENPHLCSSAVFDVP